MADHDPDSKAESWFREVQETLHPWQAEYLDAFEWLLSDNPDHVGEGRTTLLAILFIRLALKNPGKWITPFDHNVFQFKTNSPVQMAIWQLLDRYQLKPLFEIQKGGMRYKPLDHSKPT